MIGLIYPSLLIGIRRLLQRFRRWRKKHGEVEDIIVGYAQPYAVYVHELTRMKLKGKKRPKPSVGRYWDPPGAQAKFLEAPARQMARQLGIVIKNSMERGLSFETSNFQAGLRLQHASQKLVPIDFGPLVASAYTAKKSEETQVASKALQQSSFLKYKKSR